jgi:hypothetical protein
MDERSPERDENGEELIDESGRNQTQQRQDVDIETEMPASAPWGSGENDSA